MHSVAEAETLVLNAMAPRPAEDCPLAEAQGRVLRQPLVCDRDLPPFDRVTMDGFALRHAAWRAGVRRFRIAGMQPAGAVPHELPGADACIEVMTGAALPVGADLVVPYEDATSGDGMMTPTGDLAPGQAVHRMGSDHAAGSVVLPPGVVLRGAEIAVAAACGYAHLKVTQLPAIAVVASGDELVEVDSPVAAHQVRRSNDYALRAALIASGFPRVQRCQVRDDREEARRLLARLMTDFDVVMLTGGVSRGRLDLLPAVLAEIGVRELFRGVAQRPGKPFWFGATPEGVPVFAFPGNPASAYICLHRYGLPGLEKMSGRDARPPRTAVLTEAVTFASSSTWFLPVRVSDDAQGGRRAAPAPLNTSGDLAGLVGTDGFVELPAGPGAWKAGAAVRYWAWV